MTACDGAEAADWSTIWQSELAALAMDRESQECFAAWGQAWLAAVDSDGRTGADASPGATPAGPAFDVEQLGRQLRDALGGIGQAGTR